VKWSRCRRRATTGGPASQDAGPTRRQVEQAELVGLIRQLFHDSDGNYGVPRIYHALGRAGLQVNYKRVERLMRVHGMAGRHRRRNPRTTVAGPDGYRIPDLVNRRFDPGAPDVAWVQDITYFRYRRGLALPGRGVGSRVSSVVGVLDGRPHAHRVGHRRSRHGPGGPRW